MLGPGRTLRVKGSILYTAASGNTTDALVWSAGSGLIFDPSGATGLPDGTRPIYTFGPDGMFGYRHAVATACTSTQPCSLSSTAAAQMGHGFLRGQGARFSHMNVSNMGDDLSPWLAAEAYGAAVTVDVQDSTFTNCGPLFGASWWQTDSVFRFSGNTISGTRAPFPLAANFQNAIGTGTRNISRNVFDKPLGGPASLVLPRDVTLEDNFFGNGMNVGVSSAYLWASFRRNFVRVTAAYGIQRAIAGNVNDAYFLVDDLWPNPHVLGHINSSSATLDGLIFGYSDRAATDSGELLSLTGGAPASPTSHYYNNIIMLPDAEGYSWAEILSLLNANWLVNLTHSTWFGGWKGGGFGMVQINENFRGTAGEIQSVKSNIAFNPLLAGYVPGGTQGFLKMNTIMVSGLNADVAAPGNLDYNVGWNNAAKQTNCTGCPNQGNGYAGAWSSTPGQHDISADPRFADFQRTVELFDSKYLGNSYAAWAAGTVYQPGDFVTVSDSSVYWGLPVNYRCIAAHPADGGNKPGAGGWTTANGLLNSLTVASNVATVVTTAPHGVAAGEWIGIYGSGANLTGTYKVTSVPNATTFTVATASLANGTYTSTSTVKPWRKSWEWASLYRLRTAIAAGETYVLTGALAAAAPATCSAAAATPICRMLAWVRAGYAPTNAALRGTAHDGGDIGAVPYYAAPAGNAMFPLIWAGW